MRPLLIVSSDEVFCEVFLSRLPGTALSLEEFIAHSGDFSDETVLIVDGLSDYFPSLFERHLTALFLDNARSCKPSKLRTEFHLIFDRDYHDAYEALITVLGHLA